MLEANILIYFKVHRVGGKGERRSVREQEAWSWRRGRRHKAPAAGLAGVEEEVKP